MKVITHHSINPTHSLEIVICKITQPNSLVEVFLPPLNTSIHANRHIALLADRTAEAPRLVARRQMRQRIRQIVELATIEQLRRHVILQPQHLRYLHLNAHLATHVAQEVVARGVDLLRLVDGSVVEPQDDVAVIAIVLEVGTRDGDGLVGVVGENGEGAGCVEANAAHGCRVDVVLVEGPLHTLADAAPDVGCGLLIVTGLWLPELDVLCSYCLEVSLRAG